MKIPDGYNVGVNNSKTFPNRVAWETGTRSQRLPVSLLPNTTGKERQVGTQQRVKELTLLTPRFSNAVGSSAPLKSPPKLEMAYL
ncbi:hypothetical protein PISMIDRAFT_689801, partial [Pisolithus microcarpus 441]